MSIITGDCVEIMATLPENSVDAIVTDPPYGLEFMGKEWDRLGAGFAVGGSERFKNSPPLPSFGRTSSGTMQQWHEAWATEALRVAKPGAYLLAFGGTRTYHRLACAIEDAGWIIRDCLVWAYAQGFPKSRANLKPAWEPIVMARKPGPLRELAIDACRIATDEDYVSGFIGREKVMDNAVYGKGLGVANPQHPNGRWPANVILTDPIFDGDVDGVVGGGVVSSGKMMPTPVRSERAVYGADAADGYETMETYGDTGTYSRFFLIPKSARSDREPNAYGRLVGGLEERENVGVRYTSMAGDGRPEPAVKPVSRRNVHPTVKPVELMRHLVRLVTPTGGTVLDPFLGSGSTAIAAEMEGFAWLGIEREPSYVEIAEARLQGVQRGLGLDVPAPIKERTTPPDQKMPPPRFQANGVPKGWTGGWASDRADFRHGWRACRKGSGWPRD